MPLSEITGTQATLATIGFLVTALLSVVVWVFMQHVRALEDLKKGYNDIRILLNPYFTKIEINAREIEIVSEDLREHKEFVKEQIKDIHERINRFKKE